MTELLGYSSIIFAFLAYSAKDTGSMKIYGMIATSLFAGSIYGYGGYNGVFINVASVFIKAVSFYAGEKLVLLLKISSVPIALIFFFYINLEGLYGLLPSIALVFTIFADLQTDILKMKTIYLGSALLWLLYSISVFSPSAILYGIIGIGLLLHSTLRLKRNKLPLSVGSVND